MPELPEVETSRRGIEPHILGQKVRDVIIRQKKLRWAIPSQLKKYIVNQTVLQVERRAKYILINFETGCVILHLGMSGSLRITDQKVIPDKHDHLDICFANNKILRLRDPRKFGAVLWTRSDPLKHKLLKSLGPEPLEDEFNGDYLYARAQKRKVDIKSLIMNSHIVVGVGNIYASESLFRAGINPKRSAHRISRQRYEQLVTAIKQILQRAVEQGGTTLRDFTRENGKPGYFQQTLAVYGRSDEPCIQCGNKIRQFKQSQRTTYYCSHCQR